MTPTPATPWHDASYETFISSSLPDLLAARVPLDGYSVNRVDDYHVKVELSLKTKSGGIDLSFEDVPAPDEHGIFFVDGTPAENGGYRVVVPCPDSFDLTTANILCVGEQFAAYSEARLGDAPSDLDWDQKLAEAWLPITGWLDTFLHTQPTSQLVQSTNWLDRTTHLRRITLVPIAFAEGSPDKPHITPSLPTRSHYLMSPEDAASVVPPDLACPIIQPEGPNMGWIIEVARGAEIRDGRLVRIEGADPKDPSLNVGWSGSMIPFIEHTDSARLLMGANMMRQWIALRNTADLPSVATAQTYPDDLVEALSNPPGPIPEPALVQTGTESDDPDSWAGFNLLTAFTMWDGDTFEDGVVLSESAATKMAFAAEVDLGDKLSTRHGFKGVVSRILPDSEMPALPDGTPADAIISPTSLISRLNFGQIREAVMGRIAHAEGKPATVPAFQAPSVADLKERLKAAGLPEDGMEQLSVGGKALEHRSTVGYVYWGRLIHLARHKLRGTDRLLGPILFGERQYSTLKGLRAYATIGDLLRRATEAGNSVPTLDRIKDRLNDAGIVLEQKGDTVAFATNGAKGYTLATPIPHPWHPEIDLRAVSEGEGDLYDDVVAANDRVRRLDDNAPAPLKSAAIERLTAAVGAYLDASLTPADLEIDARVPDSGRAVIVPGPELALDQIGLPRELAWTLFGEDITAELGEDAVQRRTKDAASRLEAIATSAHLLIHKGVHITATSVFAARPILIDDPVIRIHPFHCSLLDADFDGDQVAVTRLKSEEAIREYEERLTIAGHLRHTPDALRILINRPHGINWGLTRLAATSEGRKQIAEISGEPIDERFYGKWSYQALLTDIYEREGNSDEGLARTFATYDGLMRLSFQACKESGVSINPFLGANLNLPEPPKSDDLELMHIYKEELIAELNQHTDPDDGDVGTFNSFRLTGTRGSDAQYVLYFGAIGHVGEVNGETPIVRHGYIEGLDIDETIALSARTRATISGANRQMANLDGRPTLPGRAYGVLARARRSDRPGVVFARAAARGEVDPLEDVDARILCGLPVK
jgi:hypothetical protein